MHSMQIVVKCLNMREKYENVNACQRKGYIVCSEEC